MKGRVCLLSILFAALFGSSYLPADPNGRGEVSAKAATQAGPWEFGCAPDPGYPTLLASNGARHRDPSMEWLGPAPPNTGCINTATVAPEAAPGQCNHDGVLAWGYAPVLNYAFVQVAVSISPSAPAGIRYLNVLFDADAKGNWTGPSDWPLRNLPLDLAPGTCQFPVGVFLGTIRPPFTTWIRLTVTRGPITDAKWVGTGEFPFGETEDWQLTWGPGHNYIPFPWYRVSCRSVPRDTNLISPPRTLPFRISYDGGNVRPNLALVFPGHCSGCDGRSAIWTPPPFSFVALAGQDVLAQFAPPPGAPPSPVSLQVFTPVTPCAEPRNQCFQTWLTLYLNNNPTNGLPFGLAACGFDCMCDVDHLGGLFAVQSVRGRVSDAATGDRLPGAAVRVTDQKGETVWSGQTNRKGKYDTGDLPQGSSFFDVFVELDGYVAMCPRFSVPRHPAN